MNYGIKLKELREELELSQYNVADLLNIKRSSYNQFEQQYDIVPIKRLNELANIFNTSIDYILDLNNIKKYKISNKEIDINKSKERLKDLRKSLNLTQDKLAKILNVNQSVVANFERGRNIIATPFLYTLCQKYNISADYLLGKIDNPKNLDIAI